MGGSAVGRGWVGGKSVGVYRGLYWECIRNYEVDRYSALRSLLYSVRTNSQSSRSRETLVVTVPARAVRYLFSMERVGIDVDTHWEGSDLLVREISILSR